MKTYSREITKRVPINRFGRLGFALFEEKVVTDNIDKYNKGKRVKFKEVIGLTGDNLAEVLIPDRIYEKQIKVLSETW